MTPPHIRVPPRIAVIGARKGRQGLGEHMARFLVRHGAQVPCFLGTSAASVAVAGEALRGHGIDARGYEDVEEMLALEALDGLVVASPVGTHLDYLRLALDRGLHTLCEKPLVWGTGDDPSRAGALERAFRDLGLVLMENCQWPRTLPTFRALHPDCPQRPSLTFEMWLSPSSRGAHMLVDSMSHPLSLLQALLPGAGGSLEGIRFSTRAPEAETLVTQFRYRVGDVALDVIVRLQSLAHQPRPAGYAVDGRRAERRVRMEDYALFFEDAGRSVPLPDPMELLVRDFVAAVATGSPRRDVADAGQIGSRMRMLHDIVAAYARGEEGA